MQKCAKIFLLLGATASIAAAMPEERIDPGYLAGCAVCHGDRLQGGPQGPPLNGALAHGDSVDALMTSIAKGFPNKGMLA